MHKKVLILIACVLLGSANLYGVRSSTRCVNECINTARTLETKRIAVWNKDAQMIHEQLTLMQHALENADAQQALQINFRLALMVPEMIGALPFMNELISSLSFGDNKAGKYVNTFLKSLQPNDLVFLDEQDVPETYAVIKKHIHSMNMKISPVIMLSRIKDVENSPVANLLNAAGIILVPEATLKMRMNDEQFNGLLIYQLAQIKQSHKKVGFIASLLQSNITLVMAHGALFYAINKMFGNKEVPLLKNERPQYKVYSDKDGNEIKEEITKKISNIGFLNTIREQEGIRGWTIKGIPHIILNVLWSRARRLMQKNADDTAAYNTKAAQHMTDYLKFQEGEVGFNIELWKQAYDKIEDTNVNSFTKAGYKALTSILKWKLLVTEYLFGGDQPIGERISNMESKLKRNSPIAVEDNVEIADEVVVAE